MKWTVAYEPSAETALAELWNNGPDRADITRAANRIDWVLEHDPLNAGESRDDDVRIVIEPPLAILFTTSVPDRIVSVFAVWRWSNPPTGE